MHWDLVWILPGMATDVDAPESLPFHLAELREGNRWPVVMMEDAPDIVFGDRER